MLASEKCFKSFESALKYANSHTPPAGKVYRIFAHKFDTLGFGWDKEKWNQLPDELPNLKGIVGFGSPFDYATLHQPDADRKSWFWESMYASLTDPKTKVIHREFETLVPTNTSGYYYITFCVIAVEKSCRLPSATEKK